MHSKLIVALVVFAGCGIETNVRPLGPNQYLVEAEGRSVHSTADVLEAAHQEAAATCHGPYRVLENVSGQRARGLTSEVNTLDIVLTVQCGAANGAEQAYAPPRAK